MFALDETLGWSVKGQNALFCSALSSSESKELWRSYVCNSQGEMEEQSFKYDDKVPYYVFHETKIKIENDGENLFSCCHQIFHLMSLNH